MEALAEPVTETLLEPAVLLTAVALSVALFSGLFARAIEAVGGFGQWRRRRGATKARLETTAKGDLRQGAQSGGWTGSTTSIAISTLSP